MIAEFLKPHGGDDARAEPDQHRTERALDPHAGSGISGLHARAREYEGDDRVPAHFLHADDTDRHQP